MDEYEGEPEEFQPQVDKFNVITMTYSGNEEILVTCTQCGHIFHTHCLMHWLGTGSKFCPVCKVSLLM